MESSRLRSIRIQAMNEIVPEEMGFDGSTEALLSMPEDFRKHINTRVIQDIRAHPDAWQQSAHFTVRDDPWAKNLILDSGLNFACEDLICNQFKYCWVGEGNTPVVISSGAITATCSSHTVTASGAIFTAGMVGQVLNFDTGEWRYITSFTDSTHVVLGGDVLTVGDATPFAVWAVNQTVLADPVHSTHTYFTGTGACGYQDDVVTGIRTNFRTYDFAPETSDRVFAELGWSPDANSTLWARTLIAGGTVTVVTGQQLRIIYQVFTSITPHEPENQTAAISGWPVSPSTNTDGIYFPSNPFVDQFAALSSVNSTGGTAIPGLYSVPYIFEPSGEVPVTCLTTTTDIPDFGNNYVPDDTNTFLRSSSNLKTYVPGTFYRDADVYWQLDNGNRTDFRQILFGSQPFAVPTEWIAGFTFDQDQTKDDSHTLSITFRRSIGRILTNPS